MRECYLTIMLTNNQRDDYCIKLKGEIDERNGVASYDYGKVRSWIDAMQEVERNEKLVNMTKNLIFIAA